jgi:hypothetical protein
MQAPFGSVGETSVLPPSHRVETEERCHVLPDGFSGRKPEDDGERLTQSAFTAPYLLAEVLALAGQVGVP